MPGEVAEKKLYDAAAKGDAQALRHLLDQDPLLLDRVSFTCSNKTPLHVAATKSSPLHIASAKGYVEIANELLSAAPDMCLSRDSQGRNPLHSCSHEGHVQILGLVQTAPRAAWRSFEGLGNVVHFANTLSAGVLKILKT
ncbi:UNVERIFIED_CONTAM: hypothetical protein Sradi_6770800 [Sesamum radiatum]|uniref:Uncharacterized protein n=1 Tax=Sesamum radiatum TaxID=300843 RepID=A0AAW2JTG7_SESRA